jgi:hypothetical protein
MADTPTQLNPTGLADLATRIKALHAQVIDSAKNVVRRAIEAGSALIEAKRQVGHGGWLQWLEEHCEVSDRTAEAYMKLAHNRQKLEPIFAVAANMTLTQALRAIKDKPDKGTDGSMGKYEKAQTALLKKLQQLPAEDKADAVQRTIAALNEAAAMIKKG